MDTLNKTKIKTIIKTLLILQPHKEWSSYNLAEYINSHDYRISVEVNPNILGQLIRKEKKDSTSYLYGIKMVKKNGKNIYIMEE